MILLKFIVCSFLRLFVGFLLFKYVTCECKFPNKLPGGSILYKTPRDANKTLADDLFILNFECRKGFQLVGSSYALCIDEEWIPDIPFCARIECSKPPDVRNATYEVRPAVGKIPIIRSRAVYTCNEGYELNNTDVFSLFCVLSRKSRTAVWRGKKPYCYEIKSCSDPGVSVFGSRRGKCCLPHSSLQFSCREGYELVGEREIHCLPFGQWTSMRPLCKPREKHCELPPSIPHGMVLGDKTGDYYLPYEEAKVLCEPGYTYEGPEYVFCKEDGKWESEFKQCIEWKDSEELSIPEELKEKFKTQREARPILYFMFDVSRRIGIDNFRKSIEFAKALVRKVTISDKGARAGAAKFSSSAEDIFFPYTYNNTEDVVDALDKIEFTGKTGSNNLDILLRLGVFLVNDLFLDDRKLKYIIFLLTDGKETRGGLNERAANSIKNMGVEIYCIGITGDTRINTLYSIASTSRNEIGEVYPNVYILEKYGSISWLVQDITIGTVDYSECGLGLENVVKNHTVIGNQTSIEPWPWVAALFIKTGEIPPEYKFHCGGSLVHQKFVLTAAHCLFDGNPRRGYVLRNRKSITLKLGLTDLKNETYSQEPEILEMFIHPKYNGRNYDYDIALLQLEKPVEYNAFVRPICLPSRELPDDSPLYKPRSSAWATRWGRPLSDENSLSLKEIYLPIQSKDTCIEFLREKMFKISHFTDRMICAGEKTGDISACDTDSGGPLMQPQYNYEGNVYWTQVGIASWGLECGLSYEFYTNLQLLVPWINETIVNALKDMKE